MNEMLPNTPFHMTRNFLFIALASAAVAWTGCGAPPSEEETIATAGADRLVEVDVQKMEARPFAHWFSVQGNVETDRNASLLPEFMGTIEKVLVEEGEKVRAGAALIQINTDVLDKSIAELNTQLELAVELFSRQERLWNQRIGAEVDFLTAQANKDALERRLETMGAQRERAVVRAPFGGVVDRIFAKEGEQAMPGFPLARLIDLSELYVRAGVSDHYAGRLKKGMLARLEVHGMDAVMTTLGRSGQFIHPSNRTLDITLPLPEKAGYLPNMFVSVWLQDAIADSAMVLPEAMIQQDVRGLEFVYVVRSEGGQSYVEKRSLVLGMSYQNEVEVVEGLSAGDAVVTRGATRVSNGQAVSIVK
jgi:membrane fusion protein, multidrug efflux system